MSVGLRTLMHQANETEQTLPFRIALYLGGMLVTGAVAPYWAMQDLALAYIENEARLQTRRLRKDQTLHSRAVEEIVEPYRRPLLRAREDEPEDQDELTLEDVRIVPAVTTEGARLGGVRLPVGRFPLSAVSAWWVVEGPSIEGPRSMTGLVFSVSQPLGP